MVVTFGLVFTIGKITIPLIPTKEARDLAEKAAKAGKDAAANLKENGLQMELPPGMEIPLGTAGGTLIEFLQIFDKNATLPNADKNDFPEYLKPAFKELAGLTVTITELSVKIPPKGKRELRVGIYVKPLNKVEVKPIPLAVEGVSLAFYQEFE